MFLVLAFVINSLSAQTSNPASEACAAEFQKAAAGLRACGLGSSFNASAPLFTPASLQEILGTYCNPGCSAASAAFSQAFTSPACLGFESTLPTMGLHASDLSTLTKLGQELTCLKDGSTYCAVTLMNMLKINPIVAVSYPTITVTLNQPYVCTNCAKSSAILVQKELQSLTSPLLKQAYQRAVTVWTNVQKSCSQTPNSSAPSPNTSSPSSASSSQINPSSNQAPSYSVGSTPSAPSANYGSSPTTSCSPSQTMSTYDSLNSGTQITVSSAIALVMALLYFVH